MPDQRNMSKLGYDETNFTNAIADLGRCENEIKDLNRQILVLNDNIKDLKSYIAIRATTPATSYRALRGGGKKYKKNRTKQIKKNKNKKNKSRKHK